MISPRNEDEIRYSDLNRVRKKHFDHRQSHIDRGNFRRNSKILRFTDWRGQVGRKRNEEEREKFRIRKEKKKAEMDFAFGFDVSLCLRFAANC